MSRIKFVGFAMASVLLSILVMAGGLLAVDLYIHHRAERSAGLNRWGYRGPVAGRKQPGETRVAMLGGSTTFGYGVTWDEAVPALLERELNQRAPTRVRSPLSAMIAARFGGEPRVRFVSLSRALDLSDERLSFDRMHLNVQGNRVIAAALVEPLVSVHP
jgi:hypothetical protein